MTLIFFCTTDFHSKDKKIHGSQWDTKLNILKNTGNQTASGLINIQSTKK